MRKWQSGFGGLQLLVVAGTFAGLSMVITPEFQASDELQITMEKQAKIAEAFSFADRSKNKITQSFNEIHFLPRSRTHANTMKPDEASKPEFVTHMNFQHDHAGDFIMIMAHLDHGVAENILGGEQYVYLAGVRSDENPNIIEWQCGARNVDLNLLPKDC